MTCPHSEAEHQKKVEEALAHQEQMYAVAHVDSIDSVRQSSWVNTVRHGKGCSSGRCV